VCRSCACRLRRIVAGARGEERSADDLVALFKSWRAFSQRRS
jgi:hypothetical protein